MEKDKNKDDDLIRAYSVAKTRQTQDLLSEILSYLLQNAKLSEKDTAWLHKMFENVKKRSYPFFMQEDSTLLEENFKDYKDSKNLPQEELYEKILLRDLKNIHDKSDLFYKTIKDSINKVSTYYEQQADDKIKELDKDIELNLNKSKEMLGEQAGNSNAQKYFEYAEKNRKSAQWLFWSSVSIMGSLAIFSFFALYFADIIAKDLFVRISLFFAILLPAFFMMREAKKLKDKEFQYTDMAYRIVTSEPYIDGLNLPPEEKAKLKAALVNDFFGRPIECRDDGGLPPIDNICEIIKTCIENCKR